MKMMTKQSAVVLAATIAFASAAYADLSRGVISNYRGQLVVSKDELVEAKNDKETIAKINGARLKVVEGKKNDDVVFWHFHYTAFLAKTGSANLKLEFYDDKKLSANQSLTGVDPKNAVLSGDIAINEDEGLTKGKTYTIRLENDKDQVVAETKVQFD
ncbi:MAG: hypothetical protein NT062_14320 [Proteobacteria bacterium]|nr:hypothetical protein [Pseudomonadota bacterium]